MAYALKSVVRPASWRGRPVTMALAVLALAAAGVSFLLGPSHLSAVALLLGLFHSHGFAAVIARDIRLPRALLALFVGAALGASGAALQGLPRQDAGRTTDLRA